MGYRPQQQVFKWIQSVVDSFQDCFPGFALFDEEVDAVFDEDFLQGGGMPFMFQLLFPYEKFLSEQFHGIFRGGFQDFRNSQKDWAALIDDAGVG